MNYEKSRKISSDKIIKTKKEVECLSSIVQFNDIWENPVTAAVYNMQIEGKAKVGDNAGDEDNYGGNLNENIPSLKLI